MNFLVVLGALVALAILEGLFIMSDKLPGRKKKK